MSMRGYHGLVVDGSKRKSAARDESGASRAFFSTAPSSELRANPEDLVGRTIQVRGEVGLVTGVVTKLGGSTRHTIKFSNGTVDTVQLPKKPGGKGEKFWVARDVDTRGEHHEPVFDAAFSSEKSLDAPPDRTVQEDILLNTEEISRSSAASSTQKNSPGALPSEVRVQFAFVSSRVLGLGFACSGNAVYSAMIQDLPCSLDGTPGSAEQHNLKAPSHQQMQPGMVVSSIAGQDVAGMPFQRVIECVQEQVQVAVSANCNFELGFTNLEKADLKSSLGDNLQSITTKSLGDDQAKFKVTQTAVTAATDAELEIGALPEPLFDPASGAPLNTAARQLRAEYNELGEEAQTKSMGFIAQTCTCILDLPADSAGFWRDLRSTRADCSQCVPRTTVKAVLVWSAFLFSLTAFAAPYWTSTFAAQSNPFPTPSPTPTFADDDQGGGNGASIAVLQVGVWGACRRLGYGPGQSVSVECAGYNTPLNPIASRQQCSFCLRQHRERPGDQLCDQIHGFCTGQIVAAAFFSAMQFIFSGLSSVGMSAVCCNCAKSYEKRKRSTHIAVFWGCCASSVSGLMAFSLFCNLYSRMGTEFTHVSFSLLFCVLAVVSSATAALLLSNTKSGHAGLTAAGGALLTDSSNSDQVAEQTAYVQIQENTTHTVRSYWCKLCTRSPHFRSGILNVLLVVGLLLFFCGQWGATGASSTPQSPFTSGPGDGELVHRFCEKTAISPFLSHRSRSDH
jgi:hypothetical protein